MVSTGQIRHRRLSGDEHFACCGNKEMQCAEPGERARRRARTAEPGEWQWQWQWQWRGGAVRCGAVKTGAKGGCSGGGLNWTNVDALMCLRATSASPGTLGSGRGPVGRGQAGQANYCVASALWPPAGFTALLGLAGVGRLWVHAGRAKPDHTSTPPLPPSAACCIMSR